MLSACHPESKLRNVLDERLKEDWFGKLHEYRDCTTHENLIPYDMRWRLSPWSVEHEAPEIRLADAPKKTPPTYNEKREPVSYCEFILVKVRSLVEEVYENVLLDVEKADGVLPIPKA